MKQPNLLRFPFRRGKKGSSLAMVMMIGAALVIWVMCIMPLMATTGTVSSQTQGEFNNYLDNRSAIEYCKSQLQYVAVRETPKTFVVIGDSDGTYSAITKKVGADADGSYTTYVSEGALSTKDSDDEPRNDANGQKVAALCAVELSEDATCYEITIKTYNGGEVGRLTYTATYTPSGSLLIHPEAYKKNQALPLSDFVLVDGKLGSNEVWKSNIDPSSFKVTKETLLAVKNTSDHVYADAGEYPAVFKVTAEAASDTDESSEFQQPITETFTSDAQWIMPKSGTTNETGNIKFTYSNNKMTIQMYSGSGWKDITSKCTIYYNGEKNVTPAAGCVYQISVDYTGTGDYVQDGLNVLPVSGLELGKQSGTASTPRANTVDGKVSFSVASVKKVYKKDENGKETEKYTYTVNLNVNTDKATDKKVADSYWYAVVKGDTIDKDEKNVSWQKSTEFTGLEAGQNYHFYVCNPASVTDGIFYTASKAQYIGSLLHYSEVKELKGGESYQITTKNNGNNYIGMTSSLGNESIKVLDDFVLNTGTTYTGWAAEEHDSQWAFKNSGKYLSMTGHVTVKDWKRIWKFSLDTASDFDYGLFTVSDSCTSVSRNITYEGILDTYHTTAYLTYSSGGFGGSESKNSNIRFLQITGQKPSTDPTAYEPGYALNDRSMDYGSKVFNFIAKKLNLSDDIKKDTKLYLNGQEIQSSEVPKAGIYHVLIQTANGAADLGEFSVKQRALDAPTIELTTGTNNDDQQVQLTVSGLESTGGSHYFGYQAEGENVWHWYHSTENSFTFTLPYATYSFAVRQSGDKNHATLETPYATSVTLTPIYVKLGEAESAAFLLDYNSASQTTTWYKLPEATTDKGDKIKLKPSRVELWFCDADGKWSKDYDAKTVRYYGVTVINSDHSDEEHILKIAQPVNITHANGHTSSMMRGQSLYFMGTGESINTYGNSIFLTTDLLVLNSGIADGSIFVQPYTAADERITPTLLFNASENEITVGSNKLAGRTFYAVDAYTDICNDPLEMLGNINGKSDNYTKIQYQMRKKMIPELNLDIAYANATQLSHIISGETIGWTEKGVLSGSDSSTNAAYAVCAYVSEISGSVDYKANRVLIAANTGTSYTLSVPADLTFTTRYLSVDADQIVQGSSGVKFTLKNLGLDETFIDEIIKVLFDGKVTQYQSKTLQMDYERTTNIVVNGTNTQMKAQICRYNEGADLFSSAEADQPQSLIVTYTLDEIKEMNKGSNAGSIITTVDRYVSILGDGTGSINLTSWYTNYRIFANYVYFASDVKEISITGSLSGSWISGNEPDIKVSSQESGYGSNEYLYWFQSGSTESYAGTLLYFAGDVDITRNITIFGYTAINDTKKITAGFYYVPATAEGTSLTALMDKDSDGNYLYKIDPATLKDYSIYIDENGNISDAYVDTGIYDNNIVGDGGFSGGKVQ